MKALAIIVLSMIVIVAAVFFLPFSSCAIEGDGTGGSRAVAALVALAILGGIFGLVRLIRKLNREM